ncbi:MAG: hypothetical protein M3463_01440 [Verrucomicrobiota bacterium]|nr:hypothetical protein [Verrucomicrobiota bacterium]
MPENAVSPVACPILPVHSVLPARRARRVAAFTLVEVVLAMGVISFCVIAMLGLLTVASQTGRDSLDRTENSLLFEKVINQLKIKPFDQEQTADPAEPSLFPLPALTGAGRTEAPAFLVDESNQYAGTMESAGALGRAAKVVRVIVLDAPDLGIKGMNAPEPVEEGRLAFVRVEISSSAGYKAATQPARNTSIFQTEISPLEQ